MQPLERDSGIGRGRRVAGTASSTKSCVEASNRTVRLLTDIDQADAALTLTSAFRLDPLLRWALGNPGSIDDKLLGYFDVLLGIELRKPDHRVHVVDNLSGVAVWRARDDLETPLSLKLRACPEFVRSFGAYLPRWTRMMSLLRQVRPTEPHYQLSCIGVHADSQTEHIGSRLLAKLTERCDIVGMPAYVQVTNPDAVPFFERHGFVSKGTVPLQRGAPPVEAMWRLPREPHVSRLI